MYKLLAVGVFLGAFTANGWSACDFNQAREEAKRLLQGVQPKVSGQSSKYYNYLTLPNGKEERLNSHPATDYNRRQIPVVAWNLRDCSTELLFPWREIKKGKATELQGVLGLHLEPHPVKYWNGSQTQLEFDDPQKLIVGEAWKA